MSFSKQGKCQNGCSEHILFKCSLTQLALLILDWEKQLAIFYRLQLSHKVHYGFPNGMWHVYGKLMKQIHVRHSIICMFTHITFQLYSGEPCLSTLKIYVSIDICGTMVYFRNLPEKKIFEFEKK